ncbi:MAG: PPC domain-containing protein [Anaerolineae bacterium]|nr:PPC domain-containing protein [Anaerolineae bacterium]
MNPMDQIDRFLDELARDPHAAPPVGMDADLVEFLQALAAAERVPVADAAAVRERVWRQVMAATAPSEVAPAQPSANGQKPLPFRPTLPDKEPQPMTTRVSSLDASVIPMPRASSSRRARSMRRWRPAWTALAAVIAVVLLGGLLMLLTLSNGRPGPVPSAGGPGESPAAEAGLLQGSPSPTLTTTPTTTWTFTPSPVPTGVFTATPTMWQPGEGPTVVPPLVVTATPFMMQPGTGPAVLLTPSIFPPTVVVPLVMTATPVMFAPDGSPLEPGIIPISVGNSVRSVLAPVSPQRSYSFSAQLDGPVLVSVRSQGFRTALSYQTSYTLPDGSGGGGGGGGGGGVGNEGSFPDVTADYVHLLALDLRAGEQVILTIGADADLSMDGGEFDLHVLPLEAEPLAYDVPVTNTVSDATPYRAYLLAAAPGDVYTVRAEGEVDTRLAIIRAAGAPLAEDADSGTGHNPEIVNFTFMAFSPLVTAAEAATPTYVIVGQQTRGAAGEFTLTATRNNALSVALPVLDDTLTPDPIASGETVEGTLTGAVPYHVYRFTAESASFVVAGLTAPDPATWLTVHAVSMPEGVVIGSGSGSYTSEGRSAFLALTAGQSATLIVANSGALPPEQTTPFTLVVEAFTDGSAVSLGYGEVATGTIMAERPLDVFAFEAARGDVISIRVQDGDTLDTALRLLDRYAGTIALDDDSGPGLNPEIDQYVMLQDGMYYAIVLAAEDGQSGEFTITLERDRVEDLPPMPGGALSDGALPLTPGTLASGVLLPENPMALYTFAASAGAVVNAQVLADGPVSLFSFYEAVDGSSGSGGEVHEGLVDTSDQIAFTVNQDAQITITVTGIHTSPINYTLLVSVQ